MASVWSMIVIVGVKLALWVLCKRAARDHVDGVMIARAAAAAAAAANNNKNVEVLDMKRNDCDDDDMENNNNDAQDEPERNATYYSFMSDPTLEALAQDHWNDTLSNGIAAFALISTLRYHALWFLDPVGAILISIYIIRSWYHTGKEQIEQLTGRGAPDEFIDELLEIANSFDDRMVVDVCRAYHFGPKFLVELEVVLPKDTVLFESHDLGMELQYEIESRPEVERCFVHIDYEQRPYDEHVVSKVPELREKYKQQQRGMFGRATRSL
jgi:Co/Zn/Cd efflux system component